MRARPQRWMSHSKMLYYLIFVACCFSLSVQCVCVCCVSSSQSQFGHWSFKWFFRGMSSWCIAIAYKLYIFWLQKCSVALCCTPQSLTRLQNATKPMSTASIQVLSIWNHLRNSHLRDECVFLCRSFSLSHTHSLAAILLCFSAIASSALCIALQWTMFSRRGPPRSIQNVV